MTLHMGCSRREGSVEGDPGAIPGEAGPGGGNGAGWVI